MRKECKLRRAQYASREVVCLWARPALLRAFCDGLASKIQQHLEERAAALRAPCRAPSLWFQGYAKGHDDTRWQTLAQLTDSCSREDFEQLIAAYIKDLQKAFKRDHAKKFKPAAELDE